MQHSVISGTVSVHVSGTARHQGKNSGTMKKEKETAKSLPERTGQCLISNQEKRKNVE